MNKFNKSNHWRVSAEIVRYTMRPAAPARHIQILFLLFARLFAPQRVFARNNTMTLARARAAEIHFSAFRLAVTRCFYDRRYARRCDLHKRISVSTYRRCVTRFTDLPSCLFSPSLPSPPLFLAPSRSLFFPRTVRHVARKSAS